MKPIIKRFDRALYEENDNKAKERVKDIFKNSGVDVIVNRIKTGVDILLYFNGEHKANIETERKKVWKTDFQYDTIQIAARKKKYTGKEKKTYFIMFNEGWDQFLVIREQDLLDSKIVEVSNKYVHKGEKFFQVPKNKVIFNDITELVKEITQ